MSKPPEDKELDHNGMADLDNLLYQSELHNRKNAERPVEQREDRLYGWAKRIGDTEPSLIDKLVMKLDQKKSKPKNKSKYHPANDLTSGGTAILIILLVLLTWFMYEVIKSIFQYFSS